MNREFLFNIFILLTLNFLVKPLYLFGVETEVQNLVGIHEWGTYFELFNFVFLFQILHEPGIQSYNSKTIAQAPEKLSYYFPRIMGVKLLLGIFFLLSVIVAFFTFGFKPMLLNLLIFIALNQFLSTLYMYLRTNIASIGKYRTDSIMSAMDKILMLIIVGSLVYIPTLRERFDIIWLAYGQFAALLLSCIAALYIIGRNINGLYLHFSCKYLINLLKRSYPFALILLFMIFYTRVDGVMLGRMIDDQGYQVGLYGACFRILDAMNMVGYLFAALLLPMFASHIKDKKVINELLEIGLRILSIVVIIGSLTIFLYSKEILYWLYTDATMEFVNVMRILIGSFVMISIAYLFGTLLVANGSLKKLNILYFIGLVMNIVLNIYFIPTYQAIGAAMATLITQVLMLVGQIWLSHTEIGVRISWPLVIRIILFGLLCAILFWCIYHLIYMHFLWKIVMCIVMSLCMALIIRLLDIKELTSLVRK